MDLEPTYLADWRKARDLTLRQVGKIIDLDMTALSKMERGVTPYDQIHLQQLSKLYKVTIPDLLYTDPRRQTKTNTLGGVGFQQTPTRRKKVEGNSAATELAGLLTRATLPEEIDAIKMLVEALLARRPGDQR